MSSRILFNGCSIFTIMFGNPLEQMMAAMGFYANPPKNSYLHEISSPFFAFGPYIHFISLGVNIYKPIPIIVSVTSVLYPIGIIGMSIASKNK